MKASKETMELNIEKKIETLSEKSTLHKKIEYLQQKIINYKRIPIRIMEVCGTHTMEISRSGLRSLLPDSLCLLSGPGCPVCVTPMEQIDHIISIAKKPDVITITFGDMMKVPGSESTLERQKATKCDIKVVYSPIDSLSIAAANPDKTIVFLGIGFETTSPTIAATLIRAKSLNLENLYIYPAFKLIPPAMKALLDDKDVKIDGFLCPGHVSTIIGSSAYEALVQNYKIPCVVGGFQAEDIVDSLLMII
ncbi:hydrogenase formation protein HypD, partial [bacterium]|nr:hydrogenase formation protein HypD [bacterium]